MVGRTPSAERVAPEQVVRLAALLRQKRNELDWSRDHLARSTGLSANTIRSIESAHIAEPGFFTIAIIAEALGLNPATVHAAARRNP